MLRLAGGPRLAFCFSCAKYSVPRPALYKFHHISSLPLVACGLSLHLLLDPATRGLCSLNLSVVFAILTWELNDLHRSFCGFRIARPALWLPTIETTPNSKETTPLLTQL
ncbi:hypothetical protein BJX70DRAFT_358052 [Aspergillus crustosus]